MYALVIANIVTETNFVLSGGDYVDSKMKLCRFGE